MSKQIFFSHTWRPDALGRDNHKRVRALVRETQFLGYTTWFDEDDMKGDISASMAQGIDEAEAVIVCLTESYAKKVNDAARASRNRDNCLLEFAYANNQGKLIIPVILEPQMLDPNGWPPGVVSFHMCGRLFVDASHDNMHEAAANMARMLNVNGVRVQHKVLAALTRPTTMRLPISKFKRRFTPYKTTLSMYMTQRRQREVQL